MSLNESIVARTYLGSGQVPLFVGYVFLRASEDATATDGWRWERRRILRESVVTDPAVVVVVGFATNALVRWSSGVTRGADRMNRRSFVDQWSGHKTKENGQDSGSRSAYDGLSPSC